MTAAVSHEAVDRVLVVDDEDDICNLVAFNLRQAGFEVETVAKGRDALERARALPPPWVIVLDVMLPDMLGTAVCAAIRHDPALREIAVLMLTAQSEESR